LKLRVLESQTQNKNPEPMLRVWSLWSGAEEIRTPHELPEKTTLSAKGGAESGALTVTSLNIDPGLASLINAWPNLPEPLRAGILAMIRATGA
jgi:hypothetical protein